MFLIIEHLHGAHRMQNEKAKCTVNGMHRVKDKGTLTVIIVNLLRFSLLLLRYLTRISNSL